MQTLRYKVNPRALLGYTSLKRKERKALDSTLATLADLPEKKWPSAGAIRLDLPEPLYLLRLDDSLRAYVKPTAVGELEVVDFVRQETLDWLFRGNHNGASPE